MHNRPLLWRTPSAVISVLVLISLFFSTSVLCETPILPWNNLVTRPSRPAVVSGILSGPDAAKFGPFKLAGSRYQLQVQFLNWGRSLDRGVDLSHELELPSVQVIPVDQTRLTRTNRMWIYSGPVVGDLRVMCRDELDKAPDANTEYVVEIGQNFRFSATGYSRDPTQAQARFWIYDVLRPEEGPVAPPKVPGYNPGDGGYWDTCAWIDWVPFGWRGALYDRGGGLG